MKSLVQIVTLFLVFGEITHGSPSFFKGGGGGVKKIYLPPPPKQSKGNNGLTVISISYGGSGGSGGKGGIGGGGGHGGVGGYGGSGGSGGSGSYGYGGYGGGGGGYGSYGYGGSSGGSGGYSGFGTSGGSGTVYPTNLYKRSSYQLNHPNKKVPTSNSEKRLKRSTRGNPFGTDLVINKRLGYQSNGHSNAKHKLFIIGDKNTKVQGNSHGGGSSSSPEVIYLDGGNGGDGYGGYGGNDQAGNGNTLLISPYGVEIMGSTSNKGHGSKTSINSIVVMGGKTPIINGKSGANGLPGSSGKPGIAGVNGSDGYPGFSPNNDNYITSLFSHDHENYISGNQANGGYGGSGAKGGVGGYGGSGGFSGYGGSGGAGASGVPEIKVLKYDGQNQGGGSYSPY